MVANPVYEAWAACGPGSSVTTMISQTNEAESVAQKETLVEVTPEHVMISVTVTLGRQVSSPTNVQIPAKIEKELVGLPRILLDTDKPKPKIVEMKESKESVEVKGKKVEATKYEYTTIESSNVEAKTVSAKVKYWISKDIPGGLVQLVVDVEKPEKMITTQQVMDYTKIAK